MSHVILLSLIQQYAKECAHNLFTCRVKNPIIAQLHIMNMQDATILCHTQLTITMIPQTARYFSCWHCTYPLLLVGGQPYNTSYTNSPIIQVANNIIPRECNSTLHQQTSWHLQHMVKIKVRYHTNQNIKISQNITYNIMYHIISYYVHAHVHVPPTNMSHHLINRSAVI